jgi:anaphase-promoting complex subunit 6
LGHVYRKLGKLPEALQFHQQALSLQPLNGSTYAAIGLVHMMMNNLLEAIEAFHEALGLKPDDSFSTTMLSYAMEGLTLSPADGLGDPFEGWFEIITCVEFVLKVVLIKGSQPICHPI